MANGPTLKQFAGLWTLTFQPSKEEQWSLEEKIDKVAEAGFQALGGGADPATTPLCEKHGLDYVCYIDANKDTYKEYLKAAADVNPKRVNVQLCDHDTLPEEAAEVWIAMNEENDAKYNLNIDLEVHRDTCTETPEKTWAITDLYKEKTGKTISMCFDYSHFAVVKHLFPPYASRLIEREDVIRNARQMHFRPFNGHHCQIPATDGNGNLTDHFIHYVEFLDALIECWLKDQDEDAVLYVCPENGPIDHFYGLPGFPNVWEDAKVVQAEVDKIWKKHTS